MDFSSTASPVDVIPLDDGPTLVDAENVDLASVDFVDGSEMVLRAVWAGGVVATDGNEVTEQEWSQYVLSGTDAFGTSVDLTPFAIGDLDDFDNNHLLYFDQAITPTMLSLPGGLVIDPNGDVNPFTSVDIPEPSNFAQNFTEVTGTPFTGVALSSIAFADVDGDNDQDVLITGLNLVQQGTPGDRISKLYTNDGAGNFSGSFGYAICRR